MMARSAKKRCLNSATELNTAIVKNEDLLGVTEAAKLLHLSAAAVAAQEALMQAMKTVYCVYTEAFWNLQSTHELYDGKLLG